MKQIDWKRVEEIEFSARKVVIDNPGTAQEAAAKAMVFLVDAIQTLRAQVETLVEQRKKAVDIARSYGKTWGENNSTYLNPKSSVDPADAIADALSKSN